MEQISQPGSLTTWSWEGRSYTDFQPILLISISLPLIALRPQVPRDTSPSDVHGIRVLVKLLLDFSYCIYVCIFVRVYVFVFDELFESKF